MYVALVLSLIYVDSCMVSGVLDVVSVTGTMKLHTTAATTPTTHGAAAHTTAAAHATAAHTATSAAAHCHILHSGLYNYSDLAQSEHLLLINYLPSFLLI